jgi:molybdopterin/thiamine biosynthesis adenylyltransferase
MGIEAVAKQAESTVFVSGLGPLGVEVAKNIILAGCKELVLHDMCSPTAEDLDGQFFLSESDLKST